jgi:hypothetical protein
MHSPGHNFYGPFCGGGGSADPASGVHTRKSQSIPHGNRLSATAGSDVVSEVSVDGDVEAIADQGNEFRGTALAVCDSLEVSVARLPDGELKPFTRHSA